MTREMPFLRRARVTNYKSIASCEVVFAPLLILLGPNGAGKSNFVDALLFVADALASTPADAVARRDGLDEALRRVPEAVDEFSVELELMVELDGESKPAKYAFTLGRDVTESRSLVVRREHCVLQLAAADEEDEAWLAEFEVENGQIAGVAGSSGIGYTCPSSRPRRVNSRKFITAFGRWCFTTWTPIT